MDDETFLTYLMASLPQEEYQATILTLEANSGKTLSPLKKLKPCWMTKYEAMKEINGWTDEGDELALFVGKLHLKKTFKEQCGYCGKYGHEAFDCLEER